MSVETSATAIHPNRAGSFAVLAVPGVLAFTVPLVGLLASLLLPLYAAQARSRLWPQTSRIVGHLCAALAVTGLWLPALLFVFTQGRLGSEATSWLLLPLCAPVGASLVVPAVVAAVAYLVGTGLAVAIRNPWFWVLGAWAAPLAYSAASLWLVDFACVA